MNKPTDPFNHVCVDLTEADIRKRQDAGHRLVAANTCPVYVYTYWEIEAPQKVYVLMGPGSDIWTVHKTVTGAMESAGVPFYGPVEDLVQKSWHQLTTNGKGNIHKEPWLSTFVIYEEVLLS